jgi:hypothetical protein
MTIAEIDGFRDDKKQSMNQVPLCNFTYNDIAYCVTQPVYRVLF